MEKYEILCNENNPLPSWEDETYTRDEILDKFWDYATTEGVFEEALTIVGNKMMIGDTELTIPLIQDVWNVTIKEL